MKPAGSRRRARRRNAQGVCGTWPLLIAIPLDVAGLYLGLAALHVVPAAWPAAGNSAWLLAVGAIALFASARAVALLALHRLLRWRAASDAWSKMMAQRVERS